MTDQLDDIEGGAGTSVFVDPDTGLSATGRTMKREVYSHLGSAIGRVQTAMAQLDHIPGDAGAQNAYHSPVSIAQDNLKQARIIISWAAKYLDELDDKPEVEETNRPVLGSVATSVVIPEAQESVGAKCQCDHRIGEGCPACSPRPTVREAKFTQLLTHRVDKYTEKLVALDETGCVWQYQAVVGWTRLSTRRMATNETD